jgi:ribosomal protein S18 acetylase RimI-like enzyme
VHVLDNPVWHALKGPQRILGRTTELAGRFDEDVSPFGALADEVEADAAWRDLAQLLGPKGTVELAGDLPDRPRDWSVTALLEGVQIVGDGVQGTPSENGHQRRGTTVASATQMVPEAHALGTIAPSPVRLGPADVPEMLALVALAQPGPFEQRTIECGVYLGIRIDGRLVAMAGERVRPPGYSEISGVATHPDYRRLGLARQVVQEVADVVIERGDTPFMHVLRQNTVALQLYESLGFTTRRPMVFQCLEAPG